jgi:hypothetical protein
MGFIGDAMLVLTRRTIAPGPPMRASNADPFNVTTMLA